MLRNELKAELKVIAVGAIFLDIIVYLVWSFFAGFKLCTATGLALGTVVMLVNMILLWMFIVNSVQNSKKQASIKMTMGFLLRMFIYCAVFAFSSKTEYIDPIFTIIPAFYPKLVYMIGGIKSRGGISQ